MMISIYAMCAAPIQIDSPNHYNDPAIWPDLKTRGPLDILQDRAVIPCWIAVSNANEELWVRPLGGITADTPMTFWRTGLPFTSSNAFLYLNKTDSPRSFRVTGSMLGRGNALGTIMVKNAWLNTLDGAFDPGGDFTTPIVPAKRFYLGVTWESQTFANFTGTSTNLASALMDETGNGSLVFASSPTLISPNLGNATATSLINNGVGPSKVVITDASGKEVGATLNGLTLVGTTLSVAPPNLPAMGAD
jgi:hypothetical protein